MDRRIAKRRTDIALVKIKDSDAALLAVAHDLIFSFVDLGFDARLIARLDRWLVDAAQAFELDPLSSDSLTHRQLLGDMARSIGIVFAESSSASVEGRIRQALYDWLVTHDLLPGDPLKE